MTLGDHEQMIHNLKKLEKTNFILASKTNPDYVNASSSVISAQDDASDIFDKVNSFQEKIKPMKKVR